MAQPRRRTYRPPYRARHSYRAQRGGRPRYRCNGSLLGNLNIWTARQNPCDSGYYYRPDRTRVSREWTYKARMAWSYLAAGCDSRWIGPNRRTIDWGHGDVHCRKWARSSGWTSSERYHP